MYLRDGCFVETLTRRRRVPGEESGIARVEGGDLQPCQLLDSRGYDPLVVPTPKEGEETLEVVRNEFEWIHHFAPGVKSLEVPRLTPRLIMIDAVRSAVPEAEIFEHQVRLGGGDSPSTVVG